MFRENAVGIYLQKTYALCKHKPFGAFGLFAEGILPTGSAPAGCVEVLANLIAHVSELCVKMWIFRKLTAEETRHCIFHDSGAILAFIGFCITVDEIAVLGFCRAEISVITLVQNAFGRIKDVLEAVGVQLGPLNNIEFAVVDACDMILRCVPDLVAIGADKPFGENVYINIMSQRVLHAVADHVEIAFKPADKHYAYAAVTEFRTELREKALGIERKSFFERIECRVY